MDIEKKFSEILDKVIREENGGCNPVTDKVLQIPARIDTGYLQVFIVGKWRYICKARKQPLTKMKENEASSIIMSNTGWKKDERINYKKIVFQFV